MLRADHMESISQEVSGIRDIPSLEGLSKAAITQAVVLRLLTAAGWNVFDLSQVMPGYITGNSSVDLALMPPPGRPKGAVPPSVFIGVRPGRAKPSRVPGWSGNCWPTAPGRRYPWRR